MIEDQIHMSCFCWVSLIIAGVILVQESPNSDLEGRCPAEFSSNPN